MRALERLAHDAVCAARDHSDTTKLLINTRADVALALGADGVHLPAGELGASEVRALWMRCRATKSLIAVSAHTPADIHSAEEERADFAVLAPIFEKVQAGIRGIGIEALRAACAQTQTESKVTPGRFPVLALGGITLENAASCLEAGAAGIAAIRLFQENDIARVASALRGT